MKHIRFTEAFAQDLEDVYIFIAADNPPAAERLLAKLQERWRTLSVNPNSGRKRDELLSGLRSVAEGKYVIFYRQITVGIQLMRVLHSARDVSKAFKRQGH